LASIALFDTVRLLILANSLYKLNLHAVAPLAQMPPPQAGDRIVIFAPHEDDETLGCAGYIQQAVAAGAQVHVVLMTNGEYPEIDIVLFEEALPLHPQQFVKLGYMRQRETLAALKYLGVTDAATFLGYPNQYLDQMWLPAHWLPANPVRSIRTRSTRSPYDNGLTRRALYCGQSVLRDVETVLRRDKPNIVITLHPNDVHVDHWPTYCFVRFALEELASQGAAFAPYCRVYSYLIHRDGWPSPRGYWPALNLEPPVSLELNGDTQWVVLPLTVAQTIDKQKALRLYRTQGGSFDRLLRSFARANELFGVLPPRPWPAISSVPPSVVIHDASADLGLSALFPRGDIRDVRLARNQGRLQVAIETRGVPSPGISYHVAIHAGGVTAGDRIFVQYDWIGTRASGVLLTDSQLRHIPAGAFHVTVAGKSTMLSAPWPLNDTTTRFFFIRAWSMRRFETIDETTTNLLQILRPL
jgi:LmbE family N-acetylglucosaminyl deacetylase